jgi:hypothetical protein
MKSSKTISVENRSPVFVRAAAVAALVALASQGRVIAADVFWGNESLDALWNTTSVNFGTAAWNNATGDGAIFDALAPAAITVPADVNASSVSITADGYSFSGAGAINLVPGTSTLSPSGQPQRVFNVGNATWTAGDPVRTATVSNAITSTGAFQKMGSGILNHTGAGTTGGTVNITANGLLKANVMIGSPLNNARGGVLKYNPGGFVNATTKLGIANGFLDIGANDVTIAELNYASQTAGTPWDGIYPGYNANNGVVGSTGKLRVLGEINVIGWIGGGGGAFGNSLGANLDLGGGTQVIRAGVSNTFQLETALMLTGTISNGSLLKSIGYVQAGTVGSVDGIGLFGNNTYTGDTVLNGGSSAAYGTNQTQLIKAIAGNIIFRGANGSAQGALTLQAFGGGQVAIDNNGGVAGSTAALSGNNTPQIVGAINNNRLNDAAELQLRDGTFRYTGRPDAANPTVLNPSTETIGSVNVLAGHNSIALVAVRPSTTSTLFTGSVALTVAGNLTMAPRSTLQVAVTGTPFSTTILPVLGTDGRVFVNGTLPTADSTGILPRVVSGTDFVTYNATTGVTPFASYATDLVTAGANVNINTALGSPTVAASIAVNAIKSSSTTAGTVTIAAGQTLTVTSGMILNHGGVTRTFAGPGTIAFGATPGVLFGNSGSIAITAPVTGSAGLISSVGTNQASNMAGLTGDIDVNGGTFNHGNSGVYNGNINVRAGTYALVNTAGATTGWGTGTINLGVPEQESNLYGTVPTLALGNTPISGTGTSNMLNAVIDRNIVVNNGTTNLAGMASVAGMPVPEGLLPTISPLSNGTGSQTLNGSLTLTTSVNLQGGGASTTNTGSTIFAGNITGPGIFRLTNGRANFSGSYSNAGGFNLGRSGNFTDAIFDGTPSGVNPIVLQGGNNSLIRYKGASLPTGTITIVSGFYAPLPTTNTSFSFVPLDNVAINNPIVLAGGDLTLRPGAGITSTMTGPITGSGIIAFNGIGTMLLTDPAQAQTGPLVLAVNFPATTPATPGILGIRHRRTHQGSTTLAAGTTLMLGAGLTGPDATGTSVFNDTTSVLSIAGGATPTATLDIGHQAVIFDYTTTSQVSTVRSQIISGRGANVWTGLGIKSSAAALAPGTYAVGYAEATDAPSLLGVLSGQAFDSTAVLVRYTRQGDATLDGKTDFDDLLKLAANYNTATATWAGGDFNYSGTVDFDDLLVLAANYNTQLPASLGGDWALALASVPEPTSMLAIGAVAGLSLSRRRR